jgi:multiple sugar transport system permease protein
LRKGFEIVSVTAASHRRRTNLSARKGRTGILLTAPAILALGITVVYPLIWTVSLSLQKFSLGVNAAPPTFAGLDNYLRVLRSPAFRQALLQTLGYVAVTLAVELALALPIAVILQRETRGRRRLRLVIAVPLMIAPVVASLAFKFLFSDGYGLVNRGLDLIGVGGVSWFANVWLARGTVLVTNLWLALPFVVLVLLAGLSSISDDLKQAARMDGATSWQIFTRITVPLLKPAILIILVIRLADAFRTFDAVYVLTGGGPANSTEVMSSYLYKLMFNNADFAGGAAATVIFVLIIAASAGAIFFALRDKAVDR